MKRTPDMHRECGHLCDVSSFKQTGKNRVAKHLIAYTFSTSWMSLLLRFCMRVTHCGLVMPCVNIISVKHSFRLRYMASCQIRKIANAHAPGMLGMFSPSPQVSDPDMHHGTCVTHVPWCMPGSLTSGFLWNRRRGETFPAFPAHAQPAILRI